MIGGRPAQLPEPQLPLISAHLVYWLPSSSTGGARAEGQCYSFSDLPAGPGIKLMTSVQALLTSGCLPNLCPKSCDSTSVHNQLGDIKLLLLFLLEHKRALLPPCFLLILHTAVERTLQSQTTHLKLSHPD